MAMVLWVVAGISAMEGFKVKAEKQLLPQDVAEPFLPVEG